MRIEWFEAKGYSHLSLNNIETIRISPEKKFHWILGTNGSGKSSLLSQLTPLTASPQDYQKGGHKKLQVICDKGRFRLESDFSGPKNLFRVIRIHPDNTEEELNPGHTSTVADNLVQQIFGVNRDTHALSLGRLKFTDMRPMERKQWLTKLSDTDYSYALEYFKKLVGHYRDITGSIKVDQNRLVELRGRLLGPDEERVLLEEVNLLNSQIEGLRELMPRPEVSWGQFNAQIAQLKEELDKSYTKIRARLQKQKVILPLPGMGLLSDDLANAEAESKFLKDLTGPLYDEFDQLSRKIEEKQQTQGLDLQTLLEDRRLSLEALVTLEKDLGGLELSGPQTESLMLKFDTFRSKLENAVWSMKADEELGYHFSSLQALSDKLGSLRKQLYGNETAVSMVNRQIQELETHRYHDKTECPKCKHRWNPLFEESKLAELMQNRTDLLAKQKQIENEISSTEEEFNEHKAHFDGLAAFQSVIYEFPEFQPFYKPLIDDNVYRKFPETIPSLLNIFKHRLDVSRSANVLKDLVREKDQQIQLLQQVEASNIQSLLDQKAVIESKIKANFEQRSCLDDRIRKLSERKQLADFLEQSVKRAKEIKETLDQLQVVGLKHQQKAFLEDFLLELTRRSLEKSKLVRTVENQRHEVEALEKVIADNQEYAKGLKVVVDSLSPKEGLIAKGLTGFINHFTKMMNGLIEKIWLYPMTIQPIDIDDQNGVDLDYKFAIHVKDKPVKDISMCSTGQQEIINLAFLIVAMTFLRLDKGPLFLDEFAAHMDVSHRASAFNMISNMLSTSNFSQVFMVSHFEDSFSNALDSDITVLCKANIQLPEGLAFNQQTVIS
jgi:DNA repair exonuclease SbcCD ATPase subunit